MACGPSTVLFTGVFAKKLDDGTIDKKTEIETAEILATSSIFLSFVNKRAARFHPWRQHLREYCGGIYGQGAKEYFAKPLFRELKNGNFYDSSKLSLPPLWMWKRV